MAVVELVVAYDVSDDDDRARLAAYLSHHGVRLQRSVFQCKIPGAELPGFLDALDGFISPDDDVLHVFRQCAPCAGSRHEYGQVPLDLGVRYWVV